MTPFRLFLSRVAFSVRNTAYRGKLRVSVQDRSYVVGFKSNSEYRRARRFPSSEAAFAGAFIVASQNAHVVYDIGANVGHFALAAATVNPHARVVAIEPEPVNFARLEANSLLNRYEDRIQLLQLAAGSENCDVLLSCAREIPGNGLHRIHASENATNSIPVAVTAKSIDALIGEGVAPPPDLVKIDVEGYEMEVLRGMEQVLESHQPSLFVEVHPEYLQDFDSSENELCEFLSSKGYLFRIVRDDKIRQCNHRQKHYIFYRQ